MLIGNIQFPKFSGIRCLMLPYIQGDPFSVPDEYAPYREIVRDLFLSMGEVGFLTIDESPVRRGAPHRGARAKYGRALHTEAGRHPDQVYVWGGGGWGSSHWVTLDGDVSILIANNLDDSCAVWPAWHEDTSIDGDIGDQATRYPYEDSVVLKAGDVHRIGILTPHESLPVAADADPETFRWSYVDALAAVAGQDL